MSINRSDRKAVLSTAIAAVVMGWSVQASATNFALDNNLLTVSNAAFSENLTVSADGTATPSPTIPLASGGNGMPSFTFGLETSDVQAGEYIFWSAVLITGNNNDKYLRAFLDEVFITVAEDGSFSGNVKATTNVTVRVESEGEDLQIELQGQADDTFTFSGESIQFNASNLLELLGAADGNSANWQGIAEDFNTADSYTYEVYLNPRDYGAQGAQIGVTSGGGFVAFPLRPAAFLGNEDAYRVQGGFSTGSTSQPPVDPPSGGVLTEAEAAQALVAAGGSADHAGELVAQLEASVNPNQVSFQGSGGAEVSVSESVDGAFAAAIANPASGLTTNVSVDESIATMRFTVSKNGTVGLTVPGRAVSASQAAAGTPDGLSLRADGSYSMTQSGVSTHIVAAAHDPVALFAGLRGLGAVSLGGNDGNITIDEGVGTDFRFSGTFDYRGTQATGNTVARATLNSPSAGADASDVNYRYSVTYPDGRQQGISPFIEAGAFYTTLLNNGFSVSTNRNNGVIAISKGATELSFRPSYFIEPQTSSMLEFWQNNANQQGVAFRPTDWNNDGRMDYAIITEAGYQIAFRL